MFETTLTVIQTEADSTQMKGLCEQRGRQCKKLKMGR